MKVVIYCRVGSAGGGMTDALNRQEEYLKKYCQEQGHEVAEIFKEQASGNCQPGKLLQEAMKMIERKEVDGIAVRDFSRISRDMSDFFYFEKFMRKNEAKLLNPQFGIMDFSKGMLSGYERKQKR